MVQPWLMKPSTAAAPISSPAALAEDGVHRFSFVIHPLGLSHIHQHFRWTRLLPDALVEAVSARMPPVYLGRMTGGRSPANGQPIEGFIYSLGATPRQIMGRGAEITYRQLLEVAKQAQRRGARILGLGAFTKVVGDAGLTVARQAEIPVTSGNSLTVAATLEAAKQAVVRMGVKDLTRGRVMIDEELAEKHALADRLREDPDLFARVRAEAAAKLAKIPPQSKGVQAGPAKERRRRPLVSHA